MLTARMFDDEIHNDFNISFMRVLHQLLQLGPGPFAEIALEQSAVDLRAQSARLGDRGGGLLGAFERRAVDGIDPLERTDPLRGDVGLGPPLVGQVEPGCSTGQDLARGRPCRTRSTVVGAGCAGRAPERRREVAFVVAMGWAPTYCRVS